MKTRRIMSLVLFALLINPASPSGAEGGEAQAGVTPDGPAELEQKAAKPAQPSPPRIYVPPNRKAPRVRTEGATRGGGARTDT